MSLADFKKNWIKNYLTKDEIDTLVESARMAAHLGNQPISHFAVGVAILTEEGKYYQGSNIESVAFSLSIHGEGSAVIKARSDRSNPQVPVKLKAAAVYASGQNFDSFVTSCGSCRQLLSQFSIFLPILCIHETGVVMYETVHEKLPLGYRNFDTSVYKEGNLNKYDKAILAAHEWILRDTNSKTRDQMKKLLREWKFDEILEISNSELPISDTGKIQGEFKAGKRNFNFTTVQKMVQGFNNSLLGNSNTGSVLVGADADTLSGQIAERIAATFLFKKVKVALTQGDEEALLKKAHEKKDSFTFYVSKKENEYLISIYYNGEPISKDMIEQIIKERDAVSKYDNLHSVYDYQTFKLIDSKDLWI